MRHTHIAFTLAVLVVGCGQEPKLAATGTGDVSNPAAPRGPADQELVESCGNGRLTDVGKTVLGRRPYVQRLADRATDIVVVAEDESPIVVDLTATDGSPVRSVDAVVSDEPTRELTGSLAELAPSTVYCYSLRGLTEPAGFRTAPAQGATAPVRFVAFGDSGSGDSYQQAVFKQIMTVPFDLVLHTGDLAYDSGTRSELETNYFRAYQRMVRSFSVFPVIGNHDNATDHAAPYLAAFDLPTNGSETAPERYYSFDWGDVHFVGLDTENIGAQQAEWLERDLTENSAPWTVVFGHRPPHSSGEHGSNSAFQRWFVPVIEQHHVQLVLSGHEHDYERFYPINGVTYVVTGGGGRDTRPVGSSSSTAYSEDVLHFVFVEVSGNELLLHAIDGVGREFDSARIAAT